MASRAFSFTDPNVTSIARYAREDVLMSGWLQGEALLAGAHAAVEASGDGRDVLLGFPTHFRGQPHATFELFFNALYSGAVP